MEELTISVTTVNALRFYLSAVRSLATYRAILTLPKDRSDGRLENRHRSQVALIQKITPNSPASPKRSPPHTPLPAESNYSQRPALIRTYAVLAFVSATLITTAGAIIAAAYFTCADELMQECVSLRPTTPLSPSEAQTQCLSPSTPPAQILSIALFHLLPSLLFASIAYIYHRQTTDPAHAAHLGTGTTRRSAIRLEAHGRSPPSFSVGGGFGAGDNYHGHLTAGSGDEGEDGASI
ncbi:hypothetical protein B0H16DRAFT_1738666 [Mycena metata]|uniref:Uncharacterized protein n=1 Tax=Mycena metata TaxID=1033252 RepID=A0AAD7HHP8_9AGAR|nr:hypothetical protein B0H16DRAFT_1738666 [Mycena metata]